MSLNITKGRWVARGENVGFIYDTDDQCRGMFEPIAYIEDIIHPDHWEANAQLIAEAGTVANECGLTPRQLLEQLGSLESALESLVSLCNNSAFFSVTEEVIHAEAVLERLYKSRKEGTKK